MNPDLADAQQAYVNGILDAIGTRVLGPSEVSAVVVAKLLHLTLQTIEEVTAAARESEKVIATSPPGMEGLDTLKVQLQNVTAMIELTEGMATGFQRQLQAIMQASKLVLGVSVPGTRMPRAR